MREHSGGLSFVFTDIEGSTQLVRTQTGYGFALRIHRLLLEACFEQHGGREMGAEGDGSFFVFSSPAAAVAGAVTAQQKLEHHDWPEGLRLRVRMGVHCGPVRISAGEYVGVTVHEVARISAAAHGGQVLCSSEIADGLDETAGVELRDLGVYCLRGIPEPTTLFQVDAPGLETDFPPLRDAVRDGGVPLSVWRRTRGERPRRAPDTVDELGVTVLEDDVTVELGRASSGAAEAFRLVVLRAGEVEEDYDGLTVGGENDAAAVVNTHSRLVRVRPEA